MRTRDDVLKAFGISAAQFAGDYELKMADHIVAVEKQRDAYHAMWKAETLAKRELTDRLRELVRVVDLLRIVSVLPSPDLLTDGDWADLCDAVRALTAAEGA